jgi:hypothetical protein
VDHVLATTRAFALFFAISCGARTELDEPAPAASRHFALHFDGSEVAIVADASALHLDVGTIEAWFRVEATPGVYQAIVAKAFSNDTDDSLAIWLQDGGLLAGTNVTSPSGAVRLAWSPDGAWHFVAWTFQSNGVETLTLDASTVASIAGTQTPHFDDHPMLIGADFGDTSLTGQFVGDIDDVRIWSTVRSPAEIASDMAAIAPAPTDGVVALWNFEEGSGQVAHDAVGAHDVQLGSSATPDAADPTWVVSPR